MSTTATPQNAAVLFLDLQAEIVPNAKTLAAETVVARASILARLAALHAIPSFFSSVPPGGAFAPGVTQPLGGVPRPRTQTTAFSDTGLVDLLEATHRRVLILSGVASEIVVQRTALDAVAAGYHVHVAVDACGGIDPRTENAAWHRIMQAGGTLTSVITLGAELAGDFTSKSGGETLALVYEAMGR